MAKTVHEIASEVFQVSVELIDMSMTPDDIDKWDSLAHLRLITAVEAEYGVRLSMQQIQSIQSLGDFSTILPSDQS